MKAKFNIVYTPETINGKKNVDKKSVVRQGLLDVNTKLYTTTKGEMAFTYFDLEKSNYRTAKGQFTINYIGSVEW